MHSGCAKHRLLCQLIIPFETNKNTNMADRTRFELAKELPLCRFSRPVPSTTRPPVRKYDMRIKRFCFYFNNKILVKKFLFFPSSLFLLRILLSSRHAFVAQLDRASPSGGEGRKFESSRMHQKEPLSNPSAEKILV